MPLWTLLSAACRSVKSSPPAALTVLTLYFGISENTVKLLLVFGVLGRGLHAPAPLKKTQKKSIYFIEIPWYVVGIQWNLSPQIQKYLHHKEYHHGMMKEHVGDEIPVLKSRIPVEMQRLLPCILQRRHRLFTRNAEEVHNEFTEEGTKTHGQARRAASAGQNRTFSDDNRWNSKRVLLRSWSACWWRPFGELDVCFAEYFIHTGGRAGHAGWLSGSTVF